MSEKGKHRDNVQGKESRAIGMWTAFRDIIVESIKKGQALPVMVCLVLLLMIWKTPAEYVPKLWERIFEGQGVYLTTSVLLNILLLLGWGTHARRQRRLAAKEFERMAEERNKMQAERIEIQSSKRTK